LFTGDYNDAVTLSAVLTLSGTSAGIGPGQTITFSVGTQSCPGVTDATGAASCPLTLKRLIWAALSPSIFFAVKRGW
jgi:hypothetical protein